MLQHHARFFGKNFSLSANPVWTRKYFNAQQSAFNANKILVSRDGSTIFISNNTSVYYSTNNGLDWQLLGNRSGMYPFRISSNRGAGIAKLTDYSDGRVFLLLNNQWTPQTALPQKQGATRQGFIGSPDYWISNNVVVNEADISEDGTKAVVLLSITTTMMYSNYTVSSTTTEDANYYYNNGVWTKNSLFPSPYSEQLTFSAMMSSDGNKTIAATSYKNGGASVYIADNGTVSTLNGKYNGITTGLNEPVCKIAPDGDTFCLYDMYYQSGYNYPPQTWLTVLKNGMSSISKIDFDMVSQNHIAYGYLLGSDIEQLCVFNNNVFNALNFSELQTVDMSSIRVDFQTNGGKSVIYVYDQNTYQDYLFVN